MVLKIISGLAFAVNTWAADPQAFTKASELAQKNRKEAALQLLESNFNLHSRDLPIKVATLAASLLAGMKHWHKAEQISEAALNANFPGWQSKRPAKISSEFWYLLKALTLSKTEILEAGVEGRDAARLKSEIQSFSEILGSNTADAEAAKTYTARVQTHAEEQKASAYHYDFSMQLSYWTWEDRPTFDYHLSGKSKIFAPCLGLGFDYTNDIFHWALGACAGPGSASLQFNNATSDYDNRAKITLVAGYGSILMKLSTLGSAFGIEGDVMNVSTSGKLRDGTTASTTNQAFAVTAVGRYRVGRLDFKFKGGPVISAPSALWSFEMGYLF